MEEDSCCLYSTYTNCNIPPQVAYAATPVKTIVLDDLCTAGSYTTKSVTNGTVLDVVKTCSHGHNMEHWYDAETGISSENGYAYVGSWSSGTSGGPTVKTVPKESTAPSVALYAVKSFTNNTGVNISFSLTPTYISGYVLYNDTITVSWSSKTHAPIVISGNNYDAYSGSISVAASTVINSSLTINLGTISGTVTAIKDTTVTTSTHNATKCSVGGMVVTGEHKNVSSTTTNEKYYDSEGNVIGGSSVTSCRCTSCGASWSSGGGGISGDYTGDVYDENGNKTGYVTGGGYSGDKYGIDFTYLVGGYSYSSGSSSIGNGCYTATISTCETHHYKGEHYYCNTHGYVGTSSICTYSTSNNAYHHKTYGYVGNSPTFPAFRNTIMTDSTCAAYIDYLSTVPGHSVNVTVTRSPGSYRYTVKNTAGTIISTGVSSSNVFTFTMPTSDVTITVEQGQQAQTISLSLSSTSLGYGSTPPTLGVTGAKTALSYASSNAAVATISNTGAIALKGLGSTTFTVTAAETPSWKSATATVLLTVTKGSITTKTKPTTITINYGQSLSAATLSGGSAVNDSGSNVGGAWSWKSPSTFPVVGRASYVAVFKPTETTLYNY